MLHTVKNLFRTKSRLDEIDKIKEEEGRAETFEVDDLPGMKPEDRMVGLSLGLERCLVEVMSEAGTQEINSKILLKAVIRQFKSQLVTMILVYWVESLFKLGFSIILFYLF